MKYTKPAVSILGDVATVIQYFGPNYKTAGPIGDGPPLPHDKTIPAYDLDE
jgi:hypothetical protein